MFSKEEFISIVEKYNNSSTSGPDKLSWRHLKIIIKDNVCLNKFINIANTYIDLGYWFSHFKISTTIIISKPNKESYDLHKAYQPIILLTTIGKLIEKVIGERMQFVTISNNFIHPCQLGGLKQRSTSDTGVMLTYFICMGYVKKHTTSTLAFNIAQYFSLVNHYLFLSILVKTSFEPKVSTFFHNYLVGRKIKYLWNNYFSSLFNINIGVGQGLALSPILSVLYLLPIFHIFENQSNLKISISTLSFVDNGLLIAQNELITVSSANLFCSYNVISNFLTKFGITMEHRKMEILPFF